MPAYTARTRFDRAEVHASGFVGLRFVKEIIDVDSGEVVAEEFHRTGVNPTAPANAKEVEEQGAEPVFVSIADQIAAVDAHLVAMRASATEGAPVDKLERILQIMAEPEKE